MSCSGRRCCSLCMAGILVILSVLRPDGLLFDGTRYVLSVNCCDFTCAASKGSLDLIMAILRSCRRVVLYRRSVIDRAWSLSLLVYELQHLRCES
ncbi:hypothetical protein M440DRAFT_300564 [Trichoderma longibrachiatum ATCC 18648]|uniref:Secreted protein n=1 Tax=Trichoderma longibrachiatum ATCC 18648 TaxID=983965 RepID=A0A2T4C552_TRILO|nr:hypothetical protein M440DRAFT_300564 [Trichoderma longibrachiatum ATCC 18648]